MTRAVNADAAPAPAPRRVARRAPPALARGCALFLDIDGTLVDDAPRPDAVHVDRGLMCELPRVARLLDDALALITGRSIADVDRLFPDLALPIAGQHGSERRAADGVLHIPAMDAGVFARLRDALVALPRRHAGLFLEDKGRTLALHYRDAPQLAAHVHRVLRTSVRMLGGGHYELQRGRRMLEVRPRHRDKGTAIAEFMREPPFAGRRPVFIGDDRADEPGFAVVAGMDGWSVRVGPGPTHAQFRLRDIAAVRRWLAAAVGAASPDPGAGDSACAPSTSP